MGHSKNSMTRRLIFFLLLLTTKSLFNGKIAYFAPIYALYIDVRVIGY